ncbi:hypothetical protein HMPREF3213_03548 [Heyndrickxia coagulans]|jgi:uncharacterized membrane protein YuzA (DUF378 family)|uniref:DUF378 domain-containing protein n=4 Tax=Heyndrickxia TaxID=2837504 RepID=A0A133KBK0_HEYCO|nr:hypothetical protein HMPREF3213_03548 [Heyndrickxia coagulans]
MLFLYIEQGGREMSIVQRIALIFTIIGAINWGLIGFFNFDLVAAIFGDNSAISRVIYGIVGICGLINLGLLFKPDAEVERSTQAKPTR